MVAATSVFLLVGAAETGVGVAGANEDPAKAEADAGLGDSGAEIAVVP